MFKQFLLPFLGLLLVCGGCNLSDTNDANTSKIFRDPPFKSITDSINESPDNADLYLKRAQLLIQKKHTDLAVNDYEKAWELRPDETTALYYTASMFMAGKESEAIALLKECIKIYTDNPEFAIMISKAYLQTGQTELALKQYDLLLAKDPENFEALYERGRILAELKDTANAIASLEKAYALQPLQIFGIALANLYAETSHPKSIRLYHEHIVQNV